MHDTLACMHAFLQLIDIQCGKEAVELVSAAASPALGVVFPMCVLADAASSLPFSGRRASRPASRHCTCLRATRAVS